MIIQLYSVYDEKTAAYLPTFQSETAGSAIRAIMDALADPKHILSKHSEDYTLYQLAQWDNEDGSFKQVKKILMTVLEIKATLPPTPVEDYIADQYETISTQMKFFQEQLNRIEKNS